MSTTSTSMTSTSTMTMTTTTPATQTTTSAAGTPVSVELFIRASQVDREFRGACPISQKWSMVFHTMMKHGLMDLQITPVHMGNPPATYMRLDVARKLPVLYVQCGNDPTTGKNLTGTVYETEDDMEQFMVKWGCPNMELGSSAFQVTENLYRNFNKFLVSNNPDSMNRDLVRVDKFLEERSVPYLSGYAISYVDCHLMPKLQHIRVACHSYKQYAIDKELRHLWKYFHTMYSTEAFQQACPTDRDIFIHYSEKVNPRPNNKVPATLSDDTMTDTVPFSVEELPEYEKQSDTNGNMIDTP